MINEINFISENVTEHDKELFFGDDKEFITIDEEWIMAHVMFKSGIFPSVGQARKNGWNKPIPDGFWTKNVGKLKTWITILNKKE